MFRIVLTTLVILMAENFVMSQRAIQSGFCQRTLVKGVWRSVGDCRRNPGNILADLEEKVKSREMESTKQETTTVSPVKKPQQETTTVEPLPLYPTTDAPDTTAATSSSESTKQETTTVAPMKASQQETTLSYENPSANEPRSEVPTKAVPDTTTAASSSDCYWTSYTFKERSHKDYVQYIGSIPSLDSFTACAWISPDPNESRVSGTLFSYCVANSSHCNTIWVYFQSDEIDMRIENKGVAENNETITSRAHFCIVKSMTDERVRYYINGTENGSDKIDKEIPGGGILILGQNQDEKPSGNNPGTIIEDHQGFTGTIQDFYLWNRALNQTEMLSIKQANCSCPYDTITSFSPGNSKIKGHVTANYTARC